MWSMGASQAPTRPPAAELLIYFSVDDLGPVFERAQAMGAKLIDEPHMNEKASSVEFSLYDPDGYALTVSQWKG
jgi:predicted enzyme related to lactoylglutathione lyase